jgi:hypothetical protein
MLAGLQFIQGRTDASDHFGSGEGWFVSESGEEFAVEAGESEEGVGEVDDEKAIGVE